MRTTITAEIRIDAGLRKTAMNILKAIEPESKSRLGRRSKVHVTTRGNVVVLNITASDTTALRAIVNSYGRWIVSLMKLLPQTQK